MKTTEKTKELSYKRVDGTANYVIKNNTVFRINKDDKPLKTICLCLFCGEKFGANSAGQCAVYCSACRSKEQRDKTAEANK